MGSHENEKEGKLRIRKRKMKRQSRCRMINTVRQNSYEVASALTKAQSGLNFGQQWHGDAQRVLDCIDGKEE